tara:strand:- start:1407 stop:2144 length:738 start_codon:yes stop_codon:yes gene_type:complete
MAKVEMWPYEVTSDNGKGKYRFAKVTLTVKEIKEASEGVSQAGRAYRFPPRLVFTEDTQEEEWSWTHWVETKPGQPSKKVEHLISDDVEVACGVCNQFVVEGDVVEVVLEASPKNTSGHFRDIRELSMKAVVEPGATATPTPPSTPSAPSVPDAPSGESALGRLPVDQRIAATALTNVLAPKVWDDTPDGDEWKETMRNAIKKITLAQVPPSLMSLVKAEEAQPAPEPEPEPEVEIEEEVEELPW